MRERNRGGMGGGATLVSSRRWVPLRVGVSLGIGGQLRRNALTVVPLYIIYIILHSLT